MKHKLIILAAAVSAMLVPLRTEAQIKQSEPIIPVYPELEDPESFSMIMFGDAQSYIKFAATAPLFDR